MAGAGIEQRPWAISTKPWPVGTGEHDDPLDAQQIEADRRADDVGNRVDGADFVEVDFFDRAAVDLGLGLGQLAEDPRGHVAGPRRERAAVDHRRDVVQVAMGVLGLVLDDDLRRAKAALLDFAGHEPAAGQTERVDAGLDRREIGAGVDECPERHVAADAAGTIEVGDSHRAASVVRSLSRLTVRSVRLESLTYGQFYGEPLASAKRRDVDRSRAVRYSLSAQSGARTYDHARRSHPSPSTYTPKIWGQMPARMKVLYVTTLHRTGGWLAEAFAADSATQVSLEEAIGVTAGLARLRDEVFDAVLVSHEADVLDGLEFVEGLRAGGHDEPMIVLGHRAVGRARGRGV